MKLLSHQRFGHFVLLDPMHEGPESVLFRAQDLMASRLVALRIIDLNRLDHSAPERLARCRRDINVVSRLDDPGVVRVHEVGDTDGFPYISMDLCDGPSLASTLLRSRLSSPVAAVKVAMGLAQTLARVHERGVFHGNLKPSNILFHAGGYRIADFGTVHFRCPPLERAEMPVRRWEQAPEQQAGSPGDPRTDLYYLAALLYRLLTGVDPDPLPDRASRRSGRGRLVFAGRSVPESVQHLLHACLDPDPQRRPSDCFAFVNALQHALNAEFSGQTGRQNTTRTRVVTVPGPDRTGPRRPVGVPPLRMLENSAPEEGEIESGPPPRRHGAPSSSEQSGGWPVIPGAIGPPAAREARAEESPDLGAGKPPRGEDLEFAGPRAGPTGMDTGPQAAPGLAPVVPLRPGTSSAPSTTASGGMGSYVGVAAAVFIALIVSGGYLFSMKERASPPSNWSEAQPAGQELSRAMAPDTALPGKPGHGELEAPGSVRPSGGAEDSQGVGATPTIDDLRVRPPAHDVPAVEVMAGGDRVGESGGGAAAHLETDRARTEPPAGSEWNGGAYTPRPRGPRESSGDEVTDVVRARPLLPEEDGR